MLTIYIFDFYVINLIDYANFDVKHAKKLWKERLKIAWSKANGKNDRFSF